MPIRRPTFLALRAQTKQEKTRVLWMFAKRLRRHEHNLWLLVVYFLGFRWGDPIMDWERHMGKLETAIAQLPFGWTKLNKYGWVPVVRDNINHKLASFVHRAVYPRSRDCMVRRGLRVTLPADPLIATRRRCCKRCAIYGATLLTAIEKRVGRRELRLIYAASRTGTDVQLLHQTVADRSNEYTYVSARARNPPWDARNGPAAGHDWDDIPGSAKYCYQYCWTSRYGDHIKYSGPDTFCDRTATCAETTVTWGMRDAYPHDVCLASSIASITREDGTKRFCFAGETIATCRPTSYQQSPNDHIFRLPRN
jgi:hypothetical protein